MEARRLNPQSTIKWWRATNNHRGWLALWDREGARADAAT
jgi:hypothetical protein